MSRVPVWPGRAIAAAALALCCGCSSQFQTEDDLFAPTPRSDRRPAKSNQGSESCCNACGVCYSDPALRACPSCGGPLKPSGE